MLAVDYLEGYPSRIGRPREVKASVALTVRRAVCKLCHLLALHIHHGKLVAVKYKGQFLAVGRQFGHGSLVLVGFEHRLLADDGGMGEVGLVGRTAECGAIYICAAVALRCVVQGAVVAPAEVAFGLGCGRYLLGGAVIDRRHKHIATVKECNELAVWRGGCPAGASRAANLSQLVGKIRLYVHCHLRRLRCPGGKCVQLAVVGKRQRSVCGSRKETHRVALEVRHRHGLAIIAGNGAVHIKALLGSTLTEEIEGIACIDRTQILTGKVNEFFMSACGRGIAPYIASNRRCMVLAPLVLEAFHVLVHKALAVGRPRNVARRRCQKLA